MIFVLPEIKMAFCTCHWTPRPLPGETWGMGGNFGGLSPFALPQRVGH